MKALGTGLYRIRGPILIVATTMLLANAFFGAQVNSEQMRQVKLAWTLVGLLGWLTALLLIALGARFLPRYESKKVVAPVRGRWLALNSPATKVPSHGVRAYGQAYAIDLVYEPTEGARPAFGSGPAMRRNSDYPAYGQPVVSMVDGVVVSASDWRRDHRARSTSLAVLYLLLEAMVREFGGPGFIVGNHVTIRTTEGTYALIAHLKRGSASVAVGDLVSAGEQIGLCGNSGNSSEPHVHAQLMDRQSLWTAQGFPINFAGITLDGAPEPVHAVPQTGQHMTVGYSASFPSTESSISW